MIEYIEQWRTADGQIFDDEVEANNHEVMYWASKTNMKLFDECLEPLDLLSVETDLLRAPVGLIITGDASREDIMDALKAVNDVTDMGMDYTDIQTFSKPNEMFYYNNEEGIWEWVSSLKIKIMELQDQYDKMMKARGDK